MQNLNILSERIIGRYGKLPNVAIIGNSGSDKDSNSHVELADCVVRFNNYATRSGLTYTSDKFKCDILFSTFDLHSHGSEPSDVVIGIPFPFKAKEIHDKPSRWYPKARRWMVNPYMNMKLCEDLGLNSLGFTHPLPSLGFTALWHMHNWNANFFVSGFEWYSDLNNKTIQGWNLKNKVYPKTWNHNYVLEVNWVIKNLLPKNNIIFSEKCIRILNMAKDQL